MHETIPTLADSTPITRSTGTIPMWVTAAALALIPLAFTFGALAGMAADVHPQTVAVLTPCWWASWTLTPLLVVFSRLPLRHPALAAACRWAGWGALIPPAVTVLLALGL
ncbi:hypothetical protein N4G70_12245 [Streptomyces sp. ASQP_92]|uniref:hypothetical protein n=1 Tax=Streptomyces sp. ASQP_92 TaxID=2979116 RepID=UPI0021C1542F|nr:hypothetical protein [Streptomyces sp. ASQP_92]MCT9089643.1 hypothetical protein [Streptomyces sp. ASQP_92]